ncbi:MAG TPA: Mur ligase family protein [Micavibrio sp.]
MSTPKTYFFCGVGGSGMSALALAMLAEGHTVKGSDRSRDQGHSPEKFDALSRAGVMLYPQDGTGIDASVNVLVVSTAIEPSIPDVRAAQNQNIPIEKRAAVLASLLRQKRGIAVGGTSGKSTVTGMVGHILNYVGLDATVINGAAMMNAGNVKGLGNAVIGKGSLIVIEADESDGSIVLYEDDIAISILNNITLDHKPIAELRPLFTNFVAKAKEGAVINLDDEEAAQMATLNPRRNLTFSLKDRAATLFADNIQYIGSGSSFRVIDNDAGEAADVHLHVPGRHNIENALAALGAARLAGVALADAAEAMASFMGVKRRLEFIGQENGVTVIDDFGHNPDKVAASLAALHQSPGRVIVIFQPHGFGPMKMMRKELTEAFAAGMTPDDLLIMTDIFYAGGSAQRDISSADLIADVVRLGGKGAYLPTRDLVRDFMRAEMKPGDRVVVMGARDDTLTDFAKALLVDAKALKP